MSLVELELLATVAETGSLGQAAARHGVSQPAVSMRMTGLERTLGLQLLRRDPSGTRLTAAGLEVLAAARGVLAAGSTLAAVAERLRAESASRLRVAASFTVAEHLAPMWLEDLRSGAPQVMLTLEVLNSTQVLAALGQRRVDVGFVEGLERHPVGFDYEQVTTDELVVVVARTHPWRRRRRVSGEELAASELIVRERGSGTREVLQAALRPWGGIRTRLELGSSAAILAAARRDEVPAVLSRLAAAAELDAGRLFAVEVGDVDLTRTIRAVWSADTDLPPLARRLLEVARHDEDPARAASPKRNLGGPQPGRR